MSIADSKKKRGRPPTGIGKAIGLRLYADIQRRVDEWIAVQPDPKPTTPEALRRLIERGLDVEAAEARNRHRRVPSRQ